MVENRETGSDFQYRSVERFASIVAKQRESPGHSVNHRTMVF